MMRVIGLSGFAGSGKSTAAMWLVEHRGFTRVRFAGPLKAMMAALGLSQREIDGDLKEEPCVLLGGCSPRHAMQTLGTEWGRRLIDPDLWVRAWRKQAGDVLACGGLVVVDDCRFVNEVSAIRALDGFVIRIEGKGAAGSHVSESLPFECDLTIRNDYGDQFFARLAEL